MYSSSASAFASESMALIAAAPPRLAKNARLSISIRSPFGRISSWFRVAASIHQATRDRTRGELGLPTSFLARFAKSRELRFPCLGVPEHPTTREYSRSPGAPLDSDPWRRRVFPPPAVDSSPDRSRRDS